MRKTVLTFLVFTFLSSTFYAQSNWVNLFRKNDLSDFQQLNGTASYELKDGELIGISKMNTPNSFLATKKRYDDFILEFEVWIENDLNSGVQFRSNTRGDSIQGRVFGYQAEIETSPRKWAGGIYDESRRGWLYPLSRNQKGQHAFKNGSWNHYRIEAIGKHLSTWINHIQCANLVDTLTSKGFIAFQVHSIDNKAHEGKIVKWRNARILTSNLKKESWASSDYATEISYLDNQLTKDEKRKGWRLLNNDDFDKDNITTQSFTNFELSVDFKYDKNATGGIEYLMNQNAPFSNLEFQIIDEANHSDAKKGVNGNHLIGALYDLIPPTNLSEANSTERRIAWEDVYNRARIVVKNQKVEHWLNEIKIVEYDLTTQAFQALIQHSIFKNSKNFGKHSNGKIRLKVDHGKIDFKNVKVREF